MGENTFVRRRRGALHRTVGDDVLVLGPDDDDPVVLGGSAALLWHVLEEPTDLDEAAAWLHDHEDETADRAAITARLAEALAVLQGRGLVEAAPRSGTGRP